MLRLVLSLIMCLGLSGAVSAAEIHVSKNGNDTNSGTSSSPYLTIQKAANVAVAGDVVIIHAGTYRETVTPANDGTSGNPITFKAASGEKVVISAVNEINSWTSTGNGIFKANVTMSLGIEDNALFYDGDMMDIARWPNNADNDPYTPNANYITGGSASHINYSGIPNFDWSDGYMWYLGGHSGASFTRKITNATTSRIDFPAVDISKWPFSVHNPTVTRNGHKGIFYLFNSKDALDIAREYYYDAANQEVYFKAPGSVNPASGKCEYRARLYTFNIKKDYIVLDGVETFGGIILIDGDYNVVRNSTVRHGIPILDELDNTNAQISRGAITIEGSNTLIERNLIENGTSNGISMLAAWKGSSDNTIRNNVIRNFNTIGNHAEPVRSSCPGTVVEYNTISGGGRSGIYTSGSNATVAYNNVYDVMKVNADGGVFYTVGNDDYKNSEIHHNWFHSSTAAPHAGYKVAGIYLDNHSKGYKVYNNVVYKISWSGIQINWDNWGLDIYNNSIYDALEGMGRWENGFTLDDVVLINNYASVGPWYGTDIQSENIINANNPFINPAALNFEPSNGSYLVDAGKVIPGYTDGFKGSAPDIGAYERGGTKWVPGADWTPVDNTPGANTVAISNAPQSVVTGATFNVQIAYETSAQNEIVVAVNDPSGNWISSVKQTVNAGTGNVTISVPQSTPLALDTDYKLGISLRPVGGNFGSNLDYTSALFDIVSAAPSGTVAFSSAPTSVKTGESVEVTIDYTASQQLELFAIVNAPSGTWLANDKLTVNAGSGSATLTVTQSIDWAVGNDYKLGIAIRPVGSDFNSNIDYESVFFDVTPSVVLYSFQNQGSFNYISSANPDVLNCNATSAGSTELFEIIDNGDGTVAFKGSNGLYVSSENGTKELTCTRTTIGAWEKFVMEDHGNDVYALKGNNDQYVRNNMLCTSPGASDWQKFKINGASSARSIESISTTLSEIEIVVYPNPSRGIINLKWGTEVDQATVAVYSVNGRLMYEEKVYQSSSVDQIDLSSLNKGMYLVKFITNGNAVNKQLMIK
ncbi:T9SS type A sorting domain-containing protein [Reichenbachiella versicolor]|uniref:T9SS type A sorting domain-containing protein n=1 Tax=Reichenbachiella versicolor TaxID=1821036 RepID=UPI000D6E8FBD|nr:T9SS type A sorting domain-containing protein [Reichenbachiella versicolor]